MSVLVVNEILKEIYISDENKLKVIDFPDNFRYCGKHTLQLEDSHGIDSRINHLMIGWYKSEQLLVVLTHSGMIFVFFPENWARSPIKLDNFSEDFEDCSVWSCSLYQNHLAVGSNTHQIRIWDLDTYSTVKIIEHSHNIPSLSFNSKGFLASTSIDTSVQVSSMQSGSIFCRPCTEWGWGVVWISRSAIIHAKKLHPSNIQNLHNRYKSNLPTTYINGSFAISGTFNVSEYLEYFRRITRTVDGIPESGSDFDDDSESFMEVEEKIIVEGSKDFDEHLLIQTSKGSVHLIDPGLTACNKGKKMHVLAVYVPNLEINVGNFSRLSLLNYIEKFSLCIIGNQFGSEVIFLRLCKSRNPKSILGWDYSFVLEMTFNLDSRIFGLNVNEVDHFARVYVLTEAMSFYVFDINNSEVKKMMNLCI
jgi:hypothetical protein